jgi:hypothetical protein
MTGAPSITSVSASPGSTEGGAEFEISGANLSPGARVTFGGVPAAAALVRGGIFGTTPPHATGTVDVTVTNPDGRSATAAGAYTYVDPRTLDFNGEWEGLGTESETTLKFTIRDNMLIAVSCGPSLTDPPAVRVDFPSSPVNNGAVRFLAADALFTGRIVTRSFARGTLRIGQCFGAEISWFAQKRE